MNWPPLHIEARKPIAIIRLNNLKEALSLSQALLAGGITTLEFTMSNPNALEAIMQVKQSLSEQLVIGAGTVLSAEDASAAIQAGAQFLVTPAFLPEVIACGQSRGVEVICGAFTPTEILAAWQAGASLVKVFPAGRMGPEYIRDILGPFPTIPLVPTGGIHLENCAAFLKAGAYTVGIGSSLVNDRIVESKDWSSLTTKAREYVHLCS